VRERITHNRRGEIIHVYTSFEWPTLCRAVTRLKVNLERGTPLNFRPATDRAWDTFSDANGDFGRKRDDSETKTVEAVGIEPCRQRYANPTRPLGFPAYRYQRHAA
jgi:hypothetical protein